MEGGIMNRRDFVRIAAGTTALGALNSLAEQQTDPRTDPKGTAWLCVTCGTQYPASALAPLTCQICEDSRQYVGLTGQKWTSLNLLSQTHKNAIVQEEPGIYSIHTQPDFAIGQKAFLIKTPDGNLLWDCVALLDEDTKQEIRRLGGIAAIAISHPHFYTTMVEWSRAFGDAPIFLHELDRQWAMRPDPAIHFWSGETKALIAGTTAIRTGGHFDGFQVALWRSAGDSQGVLLAGDQPLVCMDHNWVTFMYSYPNYIPLNRRAIEKIVVALNPFAFDRLYTAFPGRVLSKNAKEIVARSADRYIRAISHDG
jgi:hypothetical protein